jgi:GR25 family glycosyltransferase involved in LPS biosynthesis
MKDIEIYCINLARRHDRWKNMQQEFDKHNFTVHKWIAIDSKEYNLRNPLACYLSHMSLLNFCNLMEQKQVLIFEDDVVLSNNFTQKLQDILKEIPSDWDALSLHCFKAETNKISDNLCKLLSPMFGTHAILLNKKGIEKVINNKNKTCLEEAYFAALDNFYAVNLENTMAFQTGEDSDIPETSIINEYKNFYDKYKHLHS